MKLLYCEDDTLINRSISKLLEYEGFEVLSCSTPEQFRELYFNEKPDMLLMDIDLNHKLTGLDLIKEVREKSNLKIAVFTQIGSKELAQELLNLNCPVILKDKDNDPISAIKQVWETGTYSPHYILEILSKKDSGLTRQERVVLKLVVKGLKTKEIANELFLSQNTIKTHIKNLFSKIGCKDRKELITRRFSCGITF